MNDKEIIPPQVKDARGIDPQKEFLIMPQNLEILEEHFRDKCFNKDLSWYEFGMGDYSLVGQIIDQFEKRTGYEVRKIFGIDTYEGIFSRAIENLGISDDDDRNIGISSMKIHSGEVDIFDIVHSSNTIHQIGSNSEILRDFILMADLLKKEGVFILTDIHPDYIDWLYKNYPEKLSEVRLKGEHVVYAKYGFDSGGENKVFNRSLGEIKKLALISGLHPIVCYSLVPGDDLIEKSKKERHRRMQENGIPLFYSMVLHKEDVPSCTCFGKVVRITKGEVKVSGFEQTVSLKKSLIPVGKCIRKGDFVLIKEGINSTTRGSCEYTTFVVYPKKEREVPWFSFKLEILNQKDV